MSIFDVVYWMRGTSHDELVELSKRSIKKAYGEAARIWEYRDAENEPAMLANVRMQLHHLQQAEPGRWVLFLDADTLATEYSGTLAGLDGSDVIVTWRDKVNGEEAGVASLMPYNYGVVGCESNAQTIEAWTWMYNRICHMHDKYQDWYGNQLALAELVGARTRLDTGYERRTTPIRWALEGRVLPITIEISQVPCEKFNYTPESIEEDVGGKCILHFKGNRKELMREYAKRLGL